MMASLDAAKTLSRKVALVTGAGRGLVLRVDGGGQCWPG